VKSGLAKKSQPHQSVRLRWSSNATADKRACEAVNRPTVLVVDDDPSFLRALKRLISTFGFHVVTFARPSELLESATPRSNACMVIDIDLPEMTGIEMCERLKSTGCNLPIVLITGRTDRKTREAAAQSDAVAVLYKPFDERPLLDAIVRAIAMSPSS
jgi:FixJ family two-component response regulator